MDEEALKALSRALAEKAKELQSGMKHRVQRDADIADFNAAFLPIIQKHVNNNRAASEVVNREAWRNQG